MEQASDPAADSATVGAGYPLGQLASAGMVIEQAQILTTHNLATLAGWFGVVPAGG